MARVFGILGAGAAAWYWRYAVHWHPVMRQSDWLEIAIYAVAGFLLGWIVGFVFSKVGND